MVGTGWMFIDTSTSLGFALVFGIFQEYYTAHGDEIKGDISSIAIIGTTSTGTLHLCSPITFTPLTRWPYLRPYYGPVGLAIMVGSFLLSFATSVWQLISTQGVMSVIGSGQLFAPTTLYLDEWFVRRKGLTYGIMWASKSVFGVALPFVMSVSQSRAARFKDFSTTMDDRDFDSDSFIAGLSQASNSSFAFVDCPAIEH